MHLLDFIYVIYLCNLTMNEQSNIPSNFGELNGTPISNKDTILDEINTALKTNKNPSIEYILVRPFIFVPLLFGGGFNYNSYGHSAVRYTTPDGKDVVMNIEGKKEGIVMVTFYDAKEYLYGTCKEKNGTQRGVYNRNMVGIRIENVEPNEIARMHEYFLKLQEFDKSGHKKFNIVFGPIMNFGIRAIIRWSKDFTNKHEEKFGYKDTDNIDYDSISDIEFGNCAKWTGDGLKAARIIKDTKVWPKSILIDIFENYTKSKVNIVCYQQPEKVKKLAYGFKGTVLFESVAPLQPLRDWLYSDLASYANCIVKVPKDSTQAVVAINTNPIKPNYIRNLVNNNYVVFGSVLISAIVLRRSTTFAKYYLNFKQYSKEKFEKVKKISK